MAAFILWENTIRRSRKRKCEIHAATSDGTIRWVADFNVSYEAWCKAYEYDVGNIWKRDTY